MERDEDFEARKVISVGFGSEMPVEHAHDEIPK